jgi:BirA family biotin operon repressor/biotin-[acetyl-CoA-carboxylase] ligase
MTFALGSRAQTAGYHLVSLETIGSTNAEALARVRSGERGPLWLVTDKQTAGRGRREREWISPKGNLAASVIETVAAPRAVAASLGFAAALALESALRRVSVEAVARSGQASPFRLKWPNDVLANGHKLAGILLEAETSSNELVVVVGMGVNIVSAPTNTPYPATSLNSQGIAAEAADLFYALSDSWAEHFALWNEGRGLPDIRKLWLERAAGVGEPVKVQNGDSVLQGVFETIDEDGRLVLSHDGQRTTIAAGDVYFGAAMSAGVA